MATPNITINPAIQTNFAGTFFKSSEGYVTGDAQDDPAIRFSMRKGINSPSATTVLWGGLAISESLLNGSIGVGATNPSGDLQSVLVPATNIAAGTAANYTGFTVFNQSTSLISTPQSRVPAAPNGGAINFYRSGSKARIALPADAAAVTAWMNGIQNPATIYWDTTNLCLTHAAGGGIIGPLPGVTLDQINPSNSRTPNVAAYGSTGLLNWSEGVGAVVVVI